MDDLLENLKRNTVGKLRRKAEDVVSRTDTKIDDKILQAGRDLSQQIGQGLRASNPARNFRQGAQRLSEGVASAPYTLAALRDNRNSQRLVPDLESDFFKNIMAEDREFEEASPLQQLYMMQTDGQPQQTSQASAEMFQRPEGAFKPAPTTQSDPYLESVKQGVLDSSNMRPAARNYLNNIPVIFDQTQRGAAAEARSGQEKIIAVNPDFRESENLDKIIKHELLHQTPRLVPPELFNPKNESIINHYTKRWGTDYMKRKPDALVEEMFAEEDLPPAYYWHIFKRVNPRANEEDFISYMKSWFMNNINREEQIPQPRRGPSLRGRAMNVGIPRSQ